MSQTTETAVVPLFRRLGSQGSCVHSEVRSGGPRASFSGRDRAGQSSSRQMRRWPRWASLTFGGSPGISPLRLSGLAPGRRLPRSLLHPTLRLSGVLCAMQGSTRPAAQAQASPSTPAPTPTETWEAPEAAPPGGRGPSGPQSLLFEPGGCWLPGVLHEGSVPHGWRNQSASEMATQECQVPSFSGLERREPAGGDVFCGPSASVPWHLKGIRHTDVSTVSCS